MLLVRCFVGLIFRGRYDAKFSSSGLECGRLTCEIKLSVKEKELALSADANFLSPRNLQACLSGGTLKAGVGYAAIDCVMLA